MNTPRIVAVVESIKENEFRIPLHPKHFSNIERKQNTLVFQTGYAKNFGISDKNIIELGYTVIPRNELLEIADIVFLLKPQPDDLRKMKSNSTLIGWCHAVQKIDIAKIAQEKKLTLIAMESMYRDHHSHLFYENNYLAGSIGVEHALSCVPHKYSTNACISVITYGAVSYGAVVKLVELGFSNISVFSRRKKENIKNQLPGVIYKQLVDINGTLYINDNEETLKAELLKADIVVNGIMQNVLLPYNFINKADIPDRKDLFIMDLSCDDHMGFDFAQATTVATPILKIGFNFYYAVDNIPSMDWKNISIHISQELLPIINLFLKDEPDNTIDEILLNATEILSGNIMNESITQYQKLQKLKNMKKPFTYDIQ